MAAVTFFSTFFTVVFVAVFFSVVAFLAFVSGLSFAHVASVRVVFFDPLVDAFALVVVDVTISVGIEFFEDCDTHFLVLILHGFAFRLTEFAIVVGIKSFGFFSPIPFSHFITSGMSGFAFFSVEFAVAIFVEFFNDVRWEFALAFFALTSFAFALTFSLTLS